MGKYLWEVSYTTEGTKGLLKEGGSARIETVEKLLADVGGTLDAAYFAFGDIDAFLIVDLPDDATAAAISLTVAASGAVSVRTRTLLTPDQIDRASKTKIAYRPPGK